MLKNTLQLPINCPLNLKDIFGNDGFGVSLILFISAIVILYCKYRLIRKRNNANSLAISTSRFTMPVALFLSIFSFNLKYYSLVKIPGETLIDDIFNAIISTFQTFTIDLDYTSYFKVLFDNSSVKQVWIYYAYILLIVAPIITGYTILSVIGSLFPEAKSSFNLRIKLLYKKRIFFFSYLTEQSFALASKLISDSKPANALVIFTNCNTNTDDDEYNALLNRAMNMGFLCIKRDFSSICLRNHLPCIYSHLNPSDNTRSKIDYVLRKLKNILAREIRYYFIHKDDLINLDEAIYMCNTGIECWKSCEVAEMYVFAQEDFSKDLLETIAGNKTKPLVCIIPYKTNTLYNLLLTHPLFLYTRDSSDIKNPEQLTVSIVGDNDWATECFKTILWCGQMKKVILNINCYVSNPFEYKRKLKYLIPELPLFKPPKDESETWDEPYCKYSIKLFKPYQWKHTQDTDIWFVCKDSDQDSIDTANYIFQKSDEKSAIFYQVNKTNIVEALRRNTNTDAASKKCLQPFGSLEDQYSVRNISGLLCSAASIYMEDWKNKNTADEALANEYKRRSSLAEAVHLPYKLAYLKDDFSYVTSSEDVEELIRRNLNSISTILSEDEKLEDLCRMEHIRWMAYMRSIGFRVCSLETLKNYNAGIVRDTKNYHHKLHSVLVPYSKLDEIKDEYNIEAGENRDFKKDMKDGFEQLTGRLNAELLNEAMKKGKSPNKPRHRTPEPSGDSEVHYKEQDGR